MALNSSKETIIAERRLNVAKLRLRGLTQRQIGKLLEKSGHLNTDGKEPRPWCAATIHLDIKAIEAAWKEEMLRAVGEHKARLLAEIREVRQKGWTDKNYKLVLDALKQERDLLGLDAPIRFEDVSEERVDREITRRLEGLADRGEAATPGETEGPRGKLH